MAVLKSRSRLVTFRLDPDEYAALRRVCMSAGARSMSEFARDAVLASVEMGGGKASLGGDLLSLTGRLQELDKLLKSVSGLVGRILGEGQDPGRAESQHPREHRGGGGAI